MLQYTTYYIQICFRAKAVFNLYVKIFFPLSVDSIDTYFLFQKKTFQLLSIKPKILNLQFSLIELVSQHDIVENHFRRSLSLK